MCRWLYSERSLVYGFNVEYDTLLLKSGGTDTGINVDDKRKIFFQQIALYAEVISNQWILSAYGSLSICDVEQRLNSYYGR